MLLDFPGGSADKESACNAGYGGPNWQLPGTFQRVVAVSFDSVLILGWRQSKRPIPLYYGNNRKHMIILQVLRLQFPLGKT